MKLLLTSAGITNNLIKNAFEELVRKTTDNCNLAFVPTATNLEYDMKRTKEELAQVKKVGFKRIEVVDIEKVPKRRWLEDFLQADAIYFEGGNTYHLLYWLRYSNLEQELESLLETRLYVGAGAGSVVTGPDIRINRDIFPEVEGYTLDDMTALQYTPFAITPHFLSPVFTKARDDDIKEFAQSVLYPIYAIDDESAIVFENGKEIIVSQGTWRKYD